jgi:hypothetical protein
MDAHYKGHHVRFTAIPVSDNSAWTFFAIALRETGAQQKVKVFTLEGQEFAAPEEATIGGLLFVKKWIEESRSRSL